MPADWNTFDGRWWTKEEIEHMKNFEQQHQKWLLARKGREFDTRRTIQFNLGLTDEERNYLEAMVDLWDSEGGSL